MSIFDKKRLTEEYSEEIRKQTDPYGYFCRNEAVKRGEGHESFNPSFCVIKDLAGLVFPGQGGEGGAPAEGKRIGIVVGVSRQGGVHDVFFHDRNL